MVREKAAPDEAMTFMLNQAAWMDRQMEALLPQKLFRQANTREGLKKINAYLKKNGVDIQGSPLGIRIIRHGAVYSSLTFEKPHDPSDN